MGAKPQKHWNPQGLSTFHEIQKYYSALRSACKSQGFHLDYFAFSMKYCRTIAVLALVMTVIPGLLRAADQWIKLSTPHFELYTTAGEKKGREAILYFEQVRSFFLEASPSKRAPEFPVRIVAFRSES